jgi:hypothetical protein
MTASYCVSASNPVAGLKFKQAKKLLRGFPQRLGEIPVTGKGICITIGFTLTLCR